MLTEVHMNPKGGSRTDLIYCMDITVDGKYLFTGGNMDMCQFSITEKKLVKEYKKIHSDIISAMGVTLDGKWLFTAGWNKDQN